jgi:hypothetical protein
MVEGYNRVKISLISKEDKLDMWVVSSTRRLEGCCRGLRRFRGITGLRSPSSEAEKFDIQCHELVGWKEAAKG